MITLITPTADRPEAFALCERWMARQTVQYDQWIVVDDGITPLTPTMGQQHITRWRNGEGVASLAGNLLAAIPHVEGDYVFIIEDDDYYQPSHIEVQVNHLQTHSLVGCRWLHYYNLGRGWRRIRNKCSALCNTAFEKRHLIDLGLAARKAIDEGTYHVDGLLWESVGYDGLHNDITVIGMKGLPGRKGIGIGHHSDGWRVDPGKRQFKAWLGEDAAYYEFS